MTRTARPITTYFFISRAEQCSLITPVAKSDCRLSKHDILARAYRALCCSSPREKTEERWSVDDMWKLRLGVELK